MTEDFVTQLQHQLRDAAERETRRGPFRRAAATARANGRRPLVGVGALAVLAAGVVLVEGRLPHRAPPPAQEPALRVVERLDLTADGGSLATGFGAVWATDSMRGDVLRVAPDGRVLARIPTGGEPKAIAAGAGAVWAYDSKSGRLLRIDPARGRVTARLRLGLRRAEVAVAALDGRVWVSDYWRMVQIDRAGRRIERRVNIGAGGLDAASGTTDGHDIIVLGKDGKVTTYDGRTGAKRSVTAPPAEMGWLNGAGRYVISEFDNGGADHGFTALDRATGRTVWRRRISAVAVDKTIVSGSTLWVQGTGTEYGETLWRIDADSGQVTGTLALPEPGATALAPVGGRLWILTPGGRLEIVSAG
jgi:outer membrane protein assembly factor BamB